VNVVFNRFWEVEIENVFNILNKNLRIDDEQLGNGRNVKAGGPTLKIYPTGNAILFVFCVACILIRSWCTVKKNSEIHLQKLKYIYTLFGKENSNQRIRFGDFDELKFSSVAMM
jgi:hypothetical protein